MLLSEVLQEMKKLTDGKKPVPFNLAIRTFNRYNKNGGKYVLYRNAELLQPPKKKGMHRLADPTPFKNPNHFQNRTRNIKVDGEIKTIHIIFIIAFNGYKVIL